MFALHIKKKGSYTVEAAMILPVILFAVIKGLTLGIQLCEEVGESANYSERLQELRAVDIFYGISELENFWGN